MSQQPAIQTLLIVGDDKIGNQFLSQLPRRADLVIARDKSMSVRRLLRVLRSGALRMTDLVRMTWCELHRPSLAPGPIDATISSNDELMRLIEQESIRRVVLFRAGLIVNRKVLALGVPILNIHCASIETHGGLASVRRALEDSIFAQTATLHRVTERIDAGEVLAVEPFQLDPARSYCWNENTAYSAGIKLALSLLDEASLPRLPAA